MSSDSRSASVLQFAPFASQISSSFWASLAKIKVDQLQLSQESIQVLGRYSKGKNVIDRVSGEEVPLPVGLHIDGEALNSNRSGESVQIGAEGNVELVGHLTNFNTVEDFKKADKGDILNSLGQELLNTIENDSEPLPKLNAFTILSFADLKKFKFIYWFAYPALLAKPTWQVCNDWRDAELMYEPEQLASIASSVSRLTSSDAGYFLVKPDGNVGAVMEYESFFRNVPLSERIVGFIDPSPHRTMPGWPLRNLLTFLSIRFGVTQIKVLCWKMETGAGVDKSVMVDLQVANDEGIQGACISSTGKPLPISSQPKYPSRPAVVGWERNASGKLAPKMADLGPLMDPKQLADQAVDLNLKLMRWRILPEIDLEKIQSTRCLLLGAGTLGCYVARALLGWGVRKITFVDSSTVSFSNPVRQSLFEYQDSLEGGKPKAKCAAESLKRIYPGVESSGHQLNIPMPGHPIPASSIDQVKKEVALLEDLMDEHDVVYLLMDSRESRWLPTVMGAVKGKLVMNTALGFDTFVAMRHGANPVQQSQKVNSTRLGCYYCNDIVAPTDSLTDRTLDQMCTVTRPGLAAIASAMTVEMMISVVQHPEGILAPAFSNTTPEASILGHLPHQLRGSLFTFSTLLIQGPSYDKCTACSPTVLEQYEQRGFEMIQEACNDDAYLRSLTGLDKLYDATDDIEVDWSEEEEGGDDDGDGDGELL
ncbi:hypothetical protein CBS101457_004535 [Exobasidium rhododendri]|nr:hypothetical protein CBS101457_004535 [Exobasidium rhododendri]